MMSAPFLNAALPPSAVPAVPATAPPMNLNVSPNRAVAPPSPPVNKQQQLPINHSSLAPLSLVQENKSKPPEKPKEALPTSEPTSNGIVDTATEKEIAPPIAAIEEPASAVPIAVSPMNVVKMPEIQREEPALPIEGPTPAPIQALAPPVTELEPKEVAPPAEVPPPAPATAAAVVVEVPKPQAPKAPKRKREAPPSETGSAEASDKGDAPSNKSRRTRAPVHHYQSPLPEIVTVINRSLKMKDNVQKSGDDKIIVFYKNEFLAVRNSEGSYYLCQCLQNIHRSSHKIRIRWLSRNESESTEGGGIYTRDFYDTTDFECILTTVALTRVDKDKFKMTPVELERVERILKRSLDVEKGEDKPDVTEEHPDGVDVTLYRDESQIQKAKKSSPKRKRSPSPKKKKSPKRPKKTKKKFSAPIAAPTKKMKSPVVAKTVPKKPVRKTPPEPAPKKSGRAERSAARDRREPPAKSLKVSPRNEKARVVAKVLRKAEPASAKQQDTKKDSTTRHKTSRGIAVQAPAPSLKEEPKKVKSPAIASIKKKTEKSKKGKSDSPARSNERRGAVSTRKKGKK